MATGIQISICNVRLHCFGRTFLQSIQEFCKMENASAPANSKFWLCLFPPLSFFTCRMPFLPPNEYLQSIEGTWKTVMK